MGSFFDAGLPQFGQPSAPAGLYGSIQIPINTWHPIVVGKATLLRIDTMNVANTGATNRPLPVVWRIRYSRGISPPELLDSGIPGINGDCYLSTPGHWMVYIEQDPGLTPLNASYVAQMFDLEQALFADFARTGSNRINEGQIQVTTPASSGGQLIFPVNPRRRYLLIQLTDNGGSSLLIRLDNGNFGPSAPFAGIIMTAQRDSLYLGDSTRWLGEIWAGRGVAGGGPTFFYIEGLE